MSNPIISITEDDDGFRVHIDNGNYGSNLRFDIETLEALNNSITDFLNERAVEGLEDFSLDDADCEGCKI